MSSKSAGSNMAAETRRLAMHYMETVRKQSSYVWFALVASHLVVVGAPTALAGACILDS